MREKRWKLTFNILAVLLLLVSLHLIGYMIRVVVVLSPPMSGKLIGFFAVGIAGVIGSLALFIVTRRLKFK